jgi:alanine-glyoxylate transaminase/serine-glyoxylate transaminase/serine-pyruvate transaminase
VITELLSVHYQVAANLVEHGENALVLHTGYFGDSFKECLETYGANVVQLKAPIGRAVTLSELEKELRSGKKYKLVTLTHVDTSTGKSVLTSGLVPH